MTEQLTSELERAVARGFLAAALTVFDAVLVVAAMDEGDELEQWRKVRDEIARRIPDETEE